MTKRSSLKSGFYATLNKWRIAWKRITDEALTNLEDEDISASDNKKIEALFGSNRNKTETANNLKTNCNSKRYQFTRLRRSISSGILDQDHRNDKKVNLPSGREERHRSLSMSSPKMEPDSVGISHSSDAYDDSLTFDNFDSVKECERLRNQTDGPFYHADKIWEIRRRLWSEQTVETLPDEHNRELFKAIPEQYYYRVYKKLVVDDKPLREPLNLQDAMKVINSGWTETKKWDNAAKGLG